MESSEKRGSFLGFEWKKTILPIIIIILLGYQTYVYYSLSKINQDIACDLYTFQKNMDIYKKQNNTELLTQTLNEWSPKSDKFQKELNKNKGNEIILIISQKIDPFFPAPCEIVSSKYCRYYMNKESYDCMKNMMNLILENSIFDTKTPEYKQVSFLIIALHFVLLSVLSYLISSIILLLFRNVKIRKKWN